MGRLVYVREDREAEPRFIGGPPRGDFGGGARGGFGGGFGGAPSGGGGRQLYVSNVCSPQCSPCDAKIRCEPGPY
jgi:hypothetical protein